MKSSAMKKSRKYIILLVFVFLIFCALGIGFLFFFSKTPNHIPESSVEVNNVSFTVDDPLGKTITVIHDSIYNEIVDLKYIYNELKELKENSSKITEEEIPENITESQRKAFQIGIHYLKTHAPSLVRFVYELEYAGVTHDDAVFVAENSKIDWKEQALMYAKTLLYKGGISKQNLNHSMIVERFTDEEIEYAWEHMNADFYEQALYQACLSKYTSNRSLNYAKVKLQSKRYTDEEIEFALTHIYGSTETHSSNS